MLRNSDRFHAKRNVTHSPGKQFTVWRGFSTVMTGHQRWFVHPSQSRCWMMIFLCFLQHLWGKANCATWHLQLLWLFWLPSAAKRPHENPNPGTQYGMRSKHIRASLGQGRTPRFKSQDLLELRHSELYLRLHVHGHFWHPDVMSPHREGCLCLYSVVIEAWQGVQ